jgi:hypothetical protein
MGSISYGGRDFGTRIVDLSTWEIAFTLQQTRRNDDEMKDEEMLNPAYHPKVISIQPSFE